MINQGMIQGNSRFVYKLKNESSSITKKNTIYFSKKIVEDINHRNSYSIKEFKEKLINTSLYKADSQLLKKLHTKLEKHVFKTHVDINLVHGYELDIKAFKKSRKEYNNAEFVLENEKFICSGAVEKMSKSYYNVQNPDTLVEKYGADTLRCYEMFLGPLEQHKPWDTKGITGVYSFIKKFWKLFYKEGKFNVINESPTPQELKTIHKTIKQTKEDIDRFSFNTPVSGFMICVNQLTSLGCNNIEILSLLCIILSPYAPHITEEMWSKMGNKKSISLAEFPEYKNEYILENKFKYPISFNGKMKFLLELSKTLSTSDIEKEVLNNTKTIKLLQGKPHKKVIVVPNRIVNIVI
jgi:leucyl-tRNA synthetase